MEGKTTPIKVHKVAPWLKTARFLSHFPPRRQTAFIERENSFHLTTLMDEGEAGHELRGARYRLGLAELEVGVKYTQLGFEVSNQTHSATIQFLQQFVRVLGMEYDTFVTYNRLNAFQEMDGKSTTGLPIKSMDFIRSLCDPVNALNKKINDKRTVDEKVAVADGSEIYIEDYPELQGMLSGGKLGGKLMLSGRMTGVLEKRNGNVQPGYSFNLVRTSRLIGARGREEQEYVRAFIDLQNGNIKQRSPTQSSSASYRFP